ncbi:MAG: SHOCT domain-containing protein [Clostridia bacterium]|nr:SHOCT domain-containing protein [Clostridia bacterium]
MENTNQAPLTYAVKRRTPEARRKSWIGTAFFGIGLLYFAILMLLMTLGSGSPFSSLTGGSGLELFFSVPFIVLGIVFWTKSNNSQNGTINFYNDKIVYHCRSEKYVLLPGQISHVSQSGTMIKIVFSGKTLTLVSDRATEITKNVNAFISAYSNNEFMQTAPEPAANTQSLSPEDIRKYKQLVDEGIITQEQFDEIIKRNT